MSSYFSASIKSVSTYFLFRTFKLYNRENTIKIRSVALRDASTNRQTKILKISFFDFVAYELFLDDCFIFFIQRTDTILLLFYYMYFIYS